MKIKIDKAPKGKDIIVTNGNKSLIMDICEKDLPRLLLAHTKNDNFYVEYSTYDQEFCDFISELIEEMHNYKKNWDKLKKWIKNKMKTCPENEWFDFEEVLCEMKDLEKGDE